jgi:uncharacterized Zn-binding protein involved in type VI secretion
MGKRAAKKGDLVTANDTHIVMIPSPGGPVPTPMTLPFAGQLDGELSATVFIDGEPAAVKGSKATNSPPHVAPGGTFQTPPSDEATVDDASPKVLLGGKGLARHGDPAKTCNDPTDLPVGQIVVASGSVLVGD